MGLFDRLFNKNPQEENKNPITYHPKLHDILFDWFNDSGLDIKKFESDFFAPILNFEMEKGNDWVKEQLNKESEYKTDLKLYVSILYLAYTFPKDEYLKATLRYLLNKKNRTHDICHNLGAHKSYFESEDTNYQVVEGAKMILKIYHALFLRLDQNFSYLSAVSSNLSQLKYTNEGLFQKIFEYIKGLKSKDKIYLLGELYAFRPFDRNTDALMPESKFQNEIKEEGIEIFTKYGLDFDLHTAFIEKVVHRTLTKKWRETEYKKRKYLKPKDFLGIESFFAEYQNRSNAVISHFLIYFKEHYLDEPRFYRQFLSYHIKNSKNDNKWLEQILSFDVQGDFYIDYLFIPLLEKYLPQISYSDGVRKQFEEKLFSNFRVTPIQKGLEILKRIANTIEEPFYRDIALMKYNDYYAILNSPYFYKGMVNDKDFKETKLLVEDLNYLFPITLKNIDKVFDPETERFGKVIVSIDGKDRNIILEDINNLLIEKKKAYQLVPIPVAKKRREGTPYMEYLCALKFFNHKEYNYFITDHIPKRFPDFKLDIAYKGIVFNVQTDIPFSELKQKIGAARADDSFETDQNWTWFKDNYVDKLSSKKEWYKIMDVALENKGTKKPNVKWKKEIKQVIDEHDVNQYFSELNVLVNASIKEEFWFFDDYKQILKAFIWTCQFYPSENSLLILKNIIEAAYTKKPGIGPRSAAIGNLGLQVLVDINSDTSFGILNLLREKTKYQRFIKVIEKHLDLFKENSDESPELLVDKSIPNFGFKNGLKKVEYEDFGIAYYFKNQKLAKKWSYNNKEYATTPKEIKGKYKEIEKEIAEEFKSINNVFKSVKNRIRSYWLHNRSWTYVEWKSFIYENELIRPWIENLVWQNESTHTSFIIKGDDFVSLSSTKVALNKEDVISLWHPIKTSNEEVMNWQVFLLDNHLTQAERQVFREFYPFSKKELELSDTPRFNDHFLVVKKLMAVANAAGWIFTYVHEDVSWPRVYIKSLNITAHLRCDYDRNDFAIPTKGLFFTKNDTSKISYSTKFEKLPLGELSMAFLSEICRDIDLFIATTSVANDVELSKKNELLGHYRNEYQYGAFSENASSKIRKTVIQLIAAAIGLKKVEFDGNFLIVHGKINSYRINLGSGFVQIKDTKKHVNILVASNTKTNRRIPIKDDETLNVILAKALLLENDEKINDEEILRQIKIV